MDGDTDASQLAPGDEALIAEVRATGGIGDRLLDLGFMPETPIRMIRRAPLGDPIEFEIRGARICLRRQEARLIRVRRTS
jgi:Fe2+ transport system protein FeoA